MTNSLFADIHHQAEAAASLARSAASIIDSGRPLPVIDITEAKDTLSDQTSKSAALRTALAYLPISTPSDARACATEIIAITADSDRWTSLEHSNVIRHCSSLYEFLERKDRNFEGTTAQKCLTGILEALQDTEMTADVWQFAGIIANGLVDSVENFSARR